MKTSHLLAPLLLAGLALAPAAQAQEQKTAFCASSVKLGKRFDSNDQYLCETSEHTCGPYTKPTCLEDAKKGGWDVVSSTAQTLQRDYANTPCSCIGTQYVLKQKAGAVAPAAAPAAAAAVAPGMAGAAPSGAAAPAASGALAADVEALKRDNASLHRRLDQLQRQFDDLRKSLPPTW